MSYTKNTWQTGDIITADKLNNIENGIAASSGGGGDVLTVVVNRQLIASHTVHEILEYINVQHKPVLCVYDCSYICTLSCDNNNNGGVTGIALMSFNDGAAGFYVISGYNDGTEDVWSVYEYTQTFTLVCE